MTDLTKTSNPLSNSEWNGLKRSPIYREEVVVELEGDEVEDGEIMGKGDI